MIASGTPLEFHQGVLVKREDLSSPFPLPMFSKIRGVYPHIANRPETVIGCLDTFHSKAGWAVAAVCAELGKKAVVFWPQYKSERDAGAGLRYAQEQAASFGAELVVLPAGRSSVLYHQAKKLLGQMTQGTGYLMPNALKLPESVAANADEAFLTHDLPKKGVLIISVSSGTVAAGVLRGFFLRGFLGNYRVILHLGYSRSHDTLREYITQTSGVPLDWSTISLVDEGYGYKDQVRGGNLAPFPCNPYYDAKAWRWLQTNFSEVQEVAAGLPIVFWNIGA